jgi:hypothetical protein
LTDQVARFFGLNGETFYVMRYFFWRFLIRTILVFSVLSSAIQAEPDLQLSSGSRQVNLLELYSSQGCSSCPPAERWISTLKSDARLWERIVPVVFHVDYWNDLGWVDPYANADYSYRQRLHKRQGNIRSVYTPGFVMAGEEWRQWFSRSWRTTKTHIQLPEKTTGVLQAQVEEGVLQASYRSESTTPLTLNVALLGFDVTTVINKGENKGLTISQDFLVLKHQQLDSTEAVWTLALPASSYKGKTAIALWVTDVGQVAPLQAVGGWL